MIFIKIEESLGSSFNSREHLGTWICQDIDAAKEILEKNLKRDLPSKDYPTIWSMTAEAIAEAEKRVSHEKTKDIDTLLKSFIEYGESEMIEKFVRDTSHKLTGRAHVTLRKLEPWIQEQKMQLVEQAKELDSLLAQGQSSRICTIVEANVQK